MPSPGVRVKRQKATTQVVTPTSTANLGIPGWFQRGPDNDPQLLTSPQDLARVFGNPTARSRAYTQLLAYFANGGSRVYAVRVSPADAVTATGNIYAGVVDQQLLVGDNTTGPLAVTADTTPLYVNDGVTPLVAGSVSLRWRGTGTPVSGARLRNRGNTGNVDLVTSTAVYEVRVNPTTLFAGGLVRDAELDAILPGTIVVSFNPDGAGARTATIPAPSSGHIATYTNGQGSVFTFDLRTGIGSIEFAGTDIPDGSVVAASLTVAYTPTTATITATDNGAGVLSSTGLAAGTVNYTTGAVSLTFTSGGKPYTGAPVLASYSHRLFQGAASSPGAWGGAMVNGAPRGMSTRLRGDTDGFNPSTGRYTRFRLDVYLYNEATRRDALVETYEGLSLTDAEDDAFLVDTVNELSDFVRYDAENYGTQGMADLQSTARVSYALVGGDESSNNRTISSVSVPRTTSIHPRSVVISYLATDGETYTIEDDGFGALTGDVDATYATVVGGLDANAIDYATGTVNVRTGHAIAAGTLVTMSYYEVAGESSWTTAFGNTDEGQTEGEDGTFDAGNWGRNQFTNPTLQAGQTGVYALDKVDALLNVIVPDFAGDLTVTNDLLTWAASRQDQVSGPDRFIVLTTPKGYSAARASDWVLSELNSYSEFAAVYWPWVKITDPLSATGRKIVVPPLGHVAGVISRVDATRNVSKAPAGTVDGALVFLEGLETTPSQADLDLVADSRINALRDSTQTGRCVWGARTLSTDVDYRYIAATRLTMFLMRSVYNSTFWAAFEDSGPVLWLKLFNQIDTFMGGLFGQGYFRGSTPALAYGITVDESNNTAASIDNGEVNVDIGFAFKKPGEFVNIRFTPRRPA